MPALGAFSRDVLRSCLTVTLATFGFRGSADYESQVNIQVTKNERTSGLRVHGVVGGLSRVLRVGSVAFVGRLFGRMVARASVRLEGEALAFRLQMGEWCISRMSLNSTSE